jgi:hypothetical protein
MIINNDDYNLNISNNHIIIFSTKHVHDFQFFHLINMFF